MNIRFALFCIAVGHLFGHAAMAQTPLNVPAPAWGTSSDIALTLPAEAFTPRGGLALWGTVGTGQRFRISQVIGGTTFTTDPYFDAPVDLPAGAKITGLRAHLCDANPVNHVVVVLQRTDEPSGANSTIYPNPGLTSTGAGCQSIFADLTSYNLVFDHVAQHYWVRFYLPSPSSEHQLRGAVVYYKLQISPDPASATFADVPVGHPFHRFVEALYASGITGGCGGGNYCPDAPVTRGQMAVFLAGALGLHWAP
jgi:S-layer family protein